MEKDYRNIAAKNRREYLIADKKIFQKNSHKMLKSININITWSQISGT